MRNLIFLVWIVFTSTLIQAQIQLPKNPYAPNSVWSEGHGVYCQQWTNQNSFKQASEVNPIVIPFDSDGGLLPTGTMISEKDKNDNYCFWGTNGKVLYKVVVANGKPTFMKADLNKLGIKSIIGYWTMDKNNIVYILDSETKSVKAVSHQDNSNFLSDFKLINTFNLPNNFFSDNLNYDPKGFKEKFMLKEDKFLGVKLLYSGELVISSRYGKVMILNRDFKNHIVFDVGEPLDNSMAVDEKGGIYITTMKSIIKCSWDGSKITENWRVSTNERTGSTPTLIGNSDDKEQFVAVTLKDNPMHLMLIWRNEIPVNWKALNGYDKRVAAFIPVSYGDSQNKSHFTENSLLAYGNSIVAVNFTGMLPRIQTQNKGVSKYSWDSESKKLKLEWTNPEIWIPNSMQAYSEGSNLIYAIAVKGSRRNKSFGLMAIDWNNGKEVFFTPYGNMSDRKMNNIGSGIQIGPNNEIITMSPSAIIMFTKKK